MLDNFKIKDIIVSEEALPSNTVVTKLVKSLEKKYNLHHPSRQEIQILEDKLN